MLTQPFRRYQLVECRATPIYNFPGICEGQVVRRAPVTDDSEFYSYHSRLQAKSLLAINDTKSNSKCIGSRRLTSSLGRVLIQEKS